MVDLSKLALPPDRLEDRPKWNTRPLVEEERADPYPVHVLPPIIRDAVREVEGWVKAPTSLVAASALSAVSAVAQSLFSVRRNAAMEGPATLYMLTVAGSGERKSTVDKQFIAPIKEWQAAQRKEHKRAVAEYKLDLVAWEANRPQSEDRDELLGHELARPEEPRERRLLRGDDTAEALVIALQNFPSAAVISDEAGVIFGSYSMKAENVVASLAQINILWDGGTIHQERVKRDPVHVDGPRVTMGLMVQPEVLEGFVQKTGGLARGIGYFARFLFTRPQSTVGERFFEEPPEDQSALRAFQARMSEMLRQEPAFDEMGRLDTHFVGLDAAAYDTWIAFHNEVEEYMGGDEVYSGIRGEGSKAAENAARLACCMHVFGVNPWQPISRETMAGACTLMRWYLAEAVRFAGTSGAAPEVGHAQKLEQWLVREVKRRGREGQDVLVPVNDARKKGPSCLRTNRQLDAAIELLIDHDRVRLFRRTGAKGLDLILAPAVLKDYT